MITIIDSENNSQSNENMERHKINISVFADGSVSVDEVFLGRKGDNNYTELIFDLSDLHWLESTISEYNYFLSFYNSSLPVSQDTNPQKFFFDGTSFRVPSSITDTIAMYQIVLGITEVSNDTPNGNISGENEVFISNIFKGKTITSDWLSTLLPLIQNATPRVDDGDSLSKLPLHISHNINGEISVDDNVLGNKKDRLIRRVTQFDNMGDLVNKFVIYYRLSSAGLMTDKYIEKADNYNISWITPDVTDSAGEWYMMCVYANSLYSILHVTNSLKMSVLTNFLTTDNDTYVITIDGSELTDSESLDLTVNS